jgi:hypothetical protein
MLVYTSVIVLLSTAISDKGGIIVMKMAITLEGSIEEIKPILRYLSQEQGIAVAVKEEKSPITFWTEDMIRKVWNGLTPDCKEILRAVANNGDGLTFANWLATVTSNGKFNAQTIGGRLSSLGHQIRINSYQNLPHPLITENQVYKLDPVWRSAIIKFDQETK